MTRTVDCKTAIEGLEALGIWRKFRHNRAEYPAAIKVIAKQYHAMQSRKKRAVRVAGTSRHAKSMEVAAQQCVSPSPS